MDQCSTVLITDSRIGSEFSGQTFSKFKKSNVLKELEKSLLNARIEQSCYWCAELICAGHFIELWDGLFSFYGKHIHANNLNISVYLVFRLEGFKVILREEYTGFELEARNDERIRRLFGEIICILCGTPLHYNITFIKIKPDEYSITSISDKLKAPNIEYGTQTMTPEDPSELYIAINELAYCVSLSSDKLNQHMACFWIEWIYGYEIICKKKGDVKRGSCRAFAPVASARQHDLVWIIWDVFINELNQRPDHDHKLNEKKIMDALLNIFCLQYSSACFNRRKYVLYIATALLCDKNINAVEPIMNNTRKQTILNIFENIDSIYKQIKKNEIKLPKIIASIPLAEKTSEDKMDIIFQLEDEFTPRLPT